MEARARSKYIRQSPRKVRQIADLVRGKSIPEALNILHFSRKKASKFIEKTVRSAVSNLINSEGGSGVSPEDLFIKEIYVDPGPMWKRIRPAPMGRATFLGKRTSHLSVVVAEFEDKAKKKR